MISSRTLVFLLAFAAGSACLAVSACAGSVPAPPQIDRPDAVAVIVYTHGSSSHTAADPCELAQDGWPGTPQVLVDLHGSTHDGVEIVVHRYCQSAIVGESMERIYPDPFGLRFAKVVRRASDLIELARSYQEAGVPPDRIVLTGHSTGGFASLLAQARAPDLVGGVVAFAPAFAGERVVRPPASSWANDVLKEEIAGAEGLRALVFAYEGDTYEPPDDLALWRPNTGIRIHALRSDELGGHRCRRMSAHRTFDPCFTDTQQEPILAFVLGGAGGGGQ